MNAQVLIDAIVRHTTVLIAQLATTGGIRAPLAHIANQVFVELSQELDQQGVSRKVSADMFGMALRAYLRKIQRLSESSVEQGRSLWEAVYAFLGARDFVTRAEVLTHFAREDETLLRGVLHDLVETGLVLQTGSGIDAMLRAATEDELGRMRRAGTGRPDELIWACIYLSGPSTRQELARNEGLRGSELDEALERLLAEGRIQSEVHLDGNRYVARKLVLPLGSELGWEAAVLDHFHAMVTTVSRKLSMTRRAMMEDKVGGSTYLFEVWKGHPLEEEVLSCLGRFRTAHSELRAKVRAHNDQLVEVPADAYRVVVYGGQHVSSEEEP